MQGAHFWTWFKAILAFERFLRSYGIASFLEKVAHLRRMSCCYSRPIANESSRQRAGGEDDEHHTKSNRSKMGIRGSWQGVLKFTDMLVPKENVLGVVGKGLKVALGTLDYGRCTLCAGCLGGARKAMEMAITRAKSRHQFGRAIGEFGMVKQKIAHMAETVFAIDAITYMSAGLVDKHAGDLMLETAIASLG